MGNDEQDTSPYPALRRRAGGSRAADGPGRPQGPATRPRPPEPPEQEADDEEDTLVEDMSSAGAPASAPEAPPLEKLIGELTIRTGELREELDELRETSERELAEQRVLVAALNARLREVERTSEQLHRDNEALRTELATLREQLQGPELRRIPGIGPKLAQRLQSAGVRTLEQVASWDESDVARIAPELGIPEARIHREAWVQSARDLLQP